MNYPSDWTKQELNLANFKPNGSDGSGVTLELEASGAELNLSKSS
jgi:hypothetical protein